MNRILCIFLFGFLATTAPAQVLPGATAPLPGPIIPNTFSNSPVQATAALPTPPPAEDVSPVLVQRVGLPDSAPPLVVKKEIRPVPGGGVADYGFLVVNFPADISEGPTTVLSPDGRTLTFRPTFLVVENRRTAETYLLGTITNSLGLITGTDVIYTNAFDLVNADVRYSYRGSSIEQFIIIRRNLSADFPPTWLSEDANDLSVECWTEWFDSEPLSIQPQVTVLREANVNSLEVLAADEKSDFGYLKLTPGGQAFSIGNQGSSVAVVKAWVDVAPDETATQTMKDTTPANRRFLIESFDYQAAAPTLSQLATGKEHASLSNRKGRHDRLAGTSSWRLHNADHSKALLMARNVPSGQGLEVDFNLAGCFPLPSGGISWWMAESNAFDSIGTNHGTAYNGVTYPSGELGQAFAFSGSVTQHVRVPDSSSLRPASAMTIEAWVYPTISNAWQNIAVKWDAIPLNPPQMGYAMGLDPVNRIYFGFSTNGASSGVASATSTVTLPTNQWSYVVGTFDGSYIRIYVNSALQGSTYFPYTIFPGTNALSIGACVGGMVPGAGAYAFSGRIDEVTLYNRALTTNEIQGIYNSGNAGKCSSCACVALPSSYRNWWTGDGTPSDLASTNTVILNGGSTFASAEVAQGFSLDGTGIGKVMATSNLDLGSGNSMTIEAWVKPLTNWNAPVVEWSTASATGVQLWVDYPWGGQFYMNLVDTNGVSHNTSVGGIINNAFNHIALTYNKTTGNAILYVNGIGSTTNVGTFRPRTGGDLYFGFRLLGTIYLRGLIDEVTLYSRDLTSSEIVSIYLAGVCGKCKSDTDADGMPDLWETTYFGNLNQNGTADYDSDGLTNLQEYQTGTKPNIADSDGDGVNDGREAIQGRNALINGSVSDTSNLINLQVFSPTK